MCRNKWLAPVIPVLVLIVIGGVAIGQTQTSFEILVDAQFTDTNLRPVIEPHLNRAIKPPDTSLAWSPFRANLTNIMCTNARIGNAWLLTTNGPELWINVSDLSIHCNASWAYEGLDGWMGGSGTVDISAEHSQFTGQLLIERDKGDVTVVLEACKAQFFLTKPEFKGSITATVLSYLEGPISQHLSDWLDTAGCEAMQKFTADTFPAAQTNGTHADHPVHLLTQSESLSVWGSIHKLLDINETLLGCLLLLLSGIWPLLKQGLILLLWFLP
jgi:hypothetical protein